MLSFQELLLSSAKEHGHLCPGQVIGVRLAMLGCRLIGLDNPRDPKQIKNLIVYVEMDRCAADAVAHVTGTKLGRRSLKFVDYGIMAATFVNMETDKAFRVVSKEEARDLAPVYAPEVSEKARQQLLAYQRMPDSLLFTVQKADVHVNEFDLPGPTRAKAKCALCGQVVRDKREVVMDGMTLCRPCAHGAYYKHVHEVDWPDMDWAPSDASPLSPLGFQPPATEIHKASN